MTNQSLWFHKTVIPRKSVWSWDYWATIMGWIPRISPYSNSRLTVGYNSRGPLPRQAAPHTLLQGSTIFPEAKVMVPACPQLFDASKHLQPTVMHNPLWTKSKDRPNFLKCPPPPLCPPSFFSLALLEGVSLPPEVSLSKWVLSWAFPPFQGIILLGLRAPSTSH